VNAALQPTPLPPTDIAPIIQTLTQQAAEFAATIALEAATEQYGTETLSSTIGDDIDPQRISERWHTAIQLAPQFGGNPEQTTALANDIHANATNLYLARAALNGEQATDTTPDTAACLQETITQMALRAAQVAVQRELTTGGSPLEVCRRLLLLNSDRSNKLVLITSPFAIALDHGILAPIDRTHNQQAAERHNGKSTTRRVLTGVTINHHNRDEILERMVARLHEIRHHDNGVAALKLHKDLLNRAWLTGGELPIFHYGFADALERQGYTKSGERRGFHHETMRRIRELLALLRSLYVTTWVENPKGRKRVEPVSSPFWIVERIHHHDHIETDSNIEITTDIVPIVLRENPPLYSAVTIRPGLWWLDAQMGSYYIETHPDVLKLSTSVESERIAFLAANYLAAHIRRNHNQHAGKSTPLRVGTLLEGAGITSKTEFLTSSPNSAKRLRNQLHNPQDGGALGLLHRIGAAEVNVNNEHEFTATGRDWRERFWEARLNVAIPNLGIERSNRPTQHTRKTKRPGAP
jgi:hypothetical protein